MAGIYKGALPRQESVPLSLPNGIQILAIAVSCARVWFSKPSICYSKEKPPQTNVAVAGTSSDFGLEIARRALAHGNRVAVLSNFATKYTTAQLLVLRPDVSKHDEIKAAFAKAKEVFNRIDVVFNNAGYAVAGEGEAILDDDARPLFDANFWGAAHVSQEAVRFFRDENSPQGDRLIQNSRDRRPDSDAHQGVQLLRNEAR